MITAEVKESKEVRTEFPKLMKSITTNTIVLFVDENSGTVVLDNSGYELGNYLDGWVSSNFKDFNGELTLKNN